MLPVVTVSGATETSSARSTARIAGLAVNDSEDELLAVTGSAVVELTVAVLVSVWVRRTLTVAVTV